MAHPAPSGEVLEPDLAALLAAEARLERVLDEARTRADAVRGDATLAAARDDEAAAAALLRDVAALEAELTTATAAAVAALEANTRAETARWDGLQGEALDRACDRLLARLAATIAEDAS